MAQKDPAFLFYPGDWLGGTMGMTFEEKGAYLELLIYQFNKGKFTAEDVEHVLSICSASVRHKVLQKFSTDGNYFFNQRLRYEMERRQAFSESRRQNAKGRKSEPITVPLPENNQKVTTRAYAKHMENENGNINSINTTDKIESLPISTSAASNQEITIKLLTAFDEIYLQRQRLVWREIDFEAELKSFQEKVRGSPERYTSHDTGGLRLALQAQLRNAKPRKDNPNKSRNKV